MPPVLMLRTNEAEPTGRFTGDAAESNRTFVLFDADAGGNPTNVPVLDAELRSAIRLFMETTRPGPSLKPTGTPGGAGTLDRVMPASDPQFPSLFSDQIGWRVKTGEGNAPQTTNVFGFIGAGGARPVIEPATPGYAAYMGYELDVKYTSRPYTVLPNDRMFQDQENFYDVDGKRKNLLFYPEWLRYTQWFAKDIDSNISATVNASMIFRVPSQTGVAGGIDGAVFAGIPSMTLPDTLLLCRWYGVPIRYLNSPNSYLTRLKGRINQSLFLNWPRATLLYLGCDVIRSYTPPQFLTINQRNQILAGSFAAEQLADFELKFILTTRRRFAPEAFPADLSLDPDRISNLERPNKNWLDGGHNVLPVFSTKGYQYAHTRTTPVDNYAKWAPSYLSWPFPALFQDPDVPGLIQNL